MIEQLTKHYEDHWRSKRFQFLYHEERMGISRNYENLKKDCETLKGLSVGESFIHKQGDVFIVLAKDERFIIAATDERNTYTIVDTEYGLCGPTDRIFGFDLKSGEEVQSTLVALSKGEQYISYRNSVPIDVAFKIAQTNKLKGVEKELAPDVCVTFESGRFELPPVEEIVRITITNFFEGTIKYYEFALKYCRHSKKKEHIKVRLKRINLAYQQWRKENVLDSN